MVIFDTDFGVRVCVLAKSKTFETFRHMHTHEQTNRTISYKFVSMIHLLDP